MIVGVSLRRFKENNKYKYYINESYLNYLKEHDVILLNNNNLNLMYLCDCFIITGGYDLNPLLYNKENINCNNVDDYLDKLDFKIIDYCVKNDKRLLGICRGIQSINVYFGGTLKQDIINHQDNMHIINVNDSKYLNNGLYNVNSYHHQCIGILGENLIITGESFDGCVEVIEHENYDILGVQFHPELLEKAFELNYFFDSF